jgi:phenylpropionate dioxygenase-like ring-hydroxylating dioxygenase large terminal subunit
VFSFLITIFHFAELRRADATMRVMKGIAQETLPAKWYRDGAFYELERQQIFARSWLLAAHESQLANAGDFVALTAAGYPLLVVRAENGAIHAFHNVCRHRAGPLAMDGLGQCKGKLVCSYHGWRYALDGHLTGVPDFGATDGFEPRNYALFPLACETWRGFVFVNIENNPQPFGEYVAPLDARSKQLPLEGFRFGKAVTHELACNWKTYAENFLEAYHIPHIHPFLNSAIDESRLVIDVMPPGVFWQAPQRGNTPVSGLWAWMWPCLSVNVYNDGVLMERIWPVSFSKTRLDYMYLFRDGIDQAAIDQTLAASALTTSEDKAICEAVQRNLDAGIFDTGCLSPKHEQGVAWFQSEIRRTIDRSSP